MALPRYSLNPVSVSFCWISHDAESWSAWSFGNRIIRMCWRCVTFLSCQRYGRQLADAAARGDLEALHGLLQALWQDWHQPDSLRSQFLLVPMFCGDGNQKVMTYNSMTMTMTILLSVWLRDINSDLWYMFIKGQWTQDFFSPNVHDTHISIISSNSHMHFAKKHLPAMPAWCDLHIWCPRPATLKQDDCCWNKNQPYVATAVLGMW